MYAVAVAVGFFTILEVVLAFCQVQPLSNDEDPFVGFESVLPLYVADEQAKDGRITASNRLRYFNEQSFSASKKPDTYRIFCLGGSTTYGRPYDDRTSFPGWLRNLLPLADDRREYEVINAGGISYASYRIAHLMDELCTYEPDLFIVYTGHNEFLEERTYREFDESTVIPPKLQWALGHSRSYSSLRSLYSSLRSKPKPGDGRSILPSEVAAVLDQSVGPESYRRENLQRPAVVGHLAFNLARIVERARLADADIIFVKPASNLKDFSPFKSEPNHSLSPTDRERWRKACIKGQRLRLAGDLTGSAAALRQALVIDGQYAELHYKLGATLTELGEWEEANKHLKYAVDEDICPLRATSAIQQVIEETAILRHVPLIDFPAILGAENEQRLGHTILGREWFLDHVHPSNTANRLLAFSIVEALRQRGTLPKVHSRWNSATIEKLIRRVEESIDVQQHAIALRNLSQVLGWAGKHAEAGPIAVQAVKLREAASLPDDPEVLFYASSHLAKIGEQTSAIDMLQRLLTLKPEVHEARRRLASYLFGAGNHAQAGEHFRRLHRDVNLSVNELREYAACLVQAGEFDEAIDKLESVPTKQRTHNLFLVLAEARLGRGEILNAALAYRQAISEKPDSIVARLHLARLHVSQQQTDKAKVIFAEILEMEPGMDDVRRELAALE